MNLLNVPDTQKKKVVIKLKKQKELKDEYEPTSDEMRTVLFLLTRNSTRKSNDVVKNN